MPRLSRDASVTIDACKQPLDSEHRLVLRREPPHYADEARLE